MPDDTPPLPHFHFSSLFQFLTLIFVARGEDPLTDGVVGGESLFGDGVVSGDSHGQDAGVWDHTARGCLATVPANVGTHWGRKRGWRVRQGGFKEVEHEARERGKVVATKGVRRRAGGGEEKGTSASSLINRTLFVLFTLSLSALTILGTVSWLWASQHKLEMFFHIYTKLKSQNVQFRLKHPEMCV